jgi:hypothetical protein
LLGLYAFGVFTNRPVRDNVVPFICVVAPILTYIISLNSVDWFWGYEFGFEVLILNGFLTFMGLFAVSRKKTEFVDITAVQ